VTFPRVLVLTDRRQLAPGRSMPETVAACVRAGATHVVLRELDLPHEERSALADSLTTIPGLTLIAARSRFRGATGVHLSAAQPSDDAGAALFHGCSCHDESEVRHAVVGGASYGTVSPAAPSESKPGYGPPLGPSGVRRLATSAGSMPVFALGGVTTDNAALFRDAGAHGVAVMGSVMRTESPAALVKDLIAAVGR
jgi:thiamine-phosphate pyrophosphorylase